MKQLKRIAERIVALNRVARYHHSREACMNPKDLIGRQVSFMLARCKRTPIKALGKVTQLGHAPNTVIIIAEPQSIEPRKGLTRQARRYNTEMVTGMVCCRPVSEIEVIS